MTLQENLVYQDVNNIYTWKKVKHYFMFKGKCFVEKKSYSLVNGDTDIFMAYISNCHLGTA